MGTYQISDIKHEHTLGEYLGFRCFMLVVAFLCCIVYAYFTCPDYALVTVALFYLFKGVGLIIDIFHGVDQVNRRMDYMGKSFMAPRRLDACGVHRRVRVDARPQRGHHRHDGCGAAGAGAFTICPKRRSSRNSAFN